MRKDTATSVETIVAKLIEGGPWTAQAGMIRLVEKDLCHLSQVARERLYLLIRWKISPNGAIGLFDELDRAVESGSAAEQTAAAKAVLAWWRETVNKR